jgi:type VI secretion system protein ImpK
MTSSDAALLPTTPIEATPVGAGRLALILQEAFTAVARLHAGRQPIADASAFRGQMLQLVQRADRDASGAGYDPNDVRLAIFALVSLLDECALNSQQPAMAEWARRPLQQELFGGLMAGEWFFQQIEQLLARPDTPALADLLDVYQLCLLLGFRGRYGADAGALHAVGARVSDRVSRLRGKSAEDLAPRWRPANDAIAGRDVWVRRLTIGLATAAALVLVAWGVAAVSLSTGATELARVAAPTK